MIRIVFLALLALILPAVAIAQPAPASVGAGQAQAAAGCPLSSMFIGDENAPATWQAVWGSSCTPEQIAAGNAALAAFDIRGWGIKQQYATALAAGVQLVSTGTPALNGTYAIDDASAVSISSIYSGVKGGDGLPGGGATFVYVDMAGAPHTFTAGQFLIFAKAVRDYRYALKVAELTALQPGGSWTPPTQPVKIP